MVEESFILSKDEPFDLSKMFPGVDNHYVGLSWRPSTKGEDVDLDAVLVATGDNGQVIGGLHKESFLFYNSHGRDGTSPKAFEITEDDRDGGGQAEAGPSDIDDNEAIYIKGALVDPMMTKLYIYVVFFQANGRTLKDVLDVTLRICPLVDGVPDLPSAAVFNVADIGASEGGLMAVLTRNKISGWSVEGLGTQSGDLAQVMKVHGLAGASS